MDVCEAQRESTEEMELRTKSGGNMRSLDPQIFFSYVSGIYAQHDEETCKIIAVEVDNFFITYF